MTTPEPPSDPSSYDLPPYDPTLSVPSAVEKPPMSWLLGYRLLGLRLPERYRAWVAQDVASKSFLTFRIGRTFVWFLALIGLTFLAIGLVHEPPGRTKLIQMLLIALAVSLLSSGSTLVRRTLRWQRIDRHGRPVKPKGLATLGNREAIALGLIAVVAFTGAMGLWGYALRPTGINAVPCRTPDAETVDRLRSGFKRPQTKLQRAVSVTYGEQQVVLAVLRAPGATTDKSSLFIVYSDGRVYELTDKPDESLTTFSAPPGGLDRGTGEVVMRLAACAGKRRS